jgi:hypothetical protein
MSNFAVEFAQLKPAGAYVEERVDLMKNLGPIRRQTRGQFALALGISAARFDLNVSGHLWMPARWDRRWN